MCVYIYIYIYTHTYSTSNSYILVWKLNLKQLDSYIIILNYSCGSSLQEVGVLDAKFPIQFVKIKL